jgi:hypothetical protein
MTRLTLSVLALAAAMPMAATGIRSYDLRLLAAADGSARATATLVLAGAGPGALDLPLSFEHPDGLRLEEAPPGVRLESSARNRSTLVRLQLPPGVPADATIRFGFGLAKVFKSTQPAPGQKPTLPASSRVFRHSFVNTQETVIGSYRLEFLFPPGMMAQAIREQLPKPGKTDVEPRVRLFETDGRQAAALQLANLNQGDDTSMTVELVPSRKSPAWLAAGLLMAGIYLVGFKDLVGRRRA